MLDDFLVRATLAGLGVALAAGPLGCFVVWRRMAYFGDATAHGALLGVALSVAFSLNLFAGVLIVAIAMALAANRLSDRGFAIDTALGVLAHGALAGGLLAIHWVGGGQINLHQYLFGDILAVGRADVGIIWAGALLIVVMLRWRWAKVLMSTLSTDLAAASGIDPRRERVMLSVATAMLVAISIKAVGALLIVAVLVIPAAAARPLAHTPAAMVIWATFLAGAAMIGGLQASLWWNTPAGPSIVAVAVAFFVVSLVAGATRR